MDNKARLNRFRSYLPGCWSEETSADHDGWTAENPAWGQCAVTACVAQDLFGGEIVWAAATTPDEKRHSHYFNRLPDGTILDLTRDQFPPATELAPPEGGPRTEVADGPSFTTTREYVLSFPATQRRYELLRVKVEQAMMQDDE